MVEEIRDIFWIASKVGAADWVKVKMEKLGGDR